MLQRWVSAHCSTEVSNLLAAWFKDGLKPWNISRDAPYFGFPIPNIKDKYFYVWVDAPIGYIAASLEWAQSLNSSQELKQSWQAPNTELVHFIGKDIVYFHTLFWPAMLKTAGYTLPKRIFVHGFLTLNGEKMSKSKGTFILARHYLNSGLPPDYLRYYLCSKTNGSLTDIDLNLNDFKNRINAELIGKLTNLASRSIPMLHKCHNGSLAALTAAGESLIQTARAANADIAAAYSRTQFSTAIELVRALSEQGNQYFDEAAPWRLDPSTNAADIAAIASAAVQLFRILVIYLSPVLPAYTASVRALFNETATPYSWESIHSPLPVNHRICPYTTHLASRINEQDLARLSGTPTT